MRTFLIVITLALAASAGANLLSNGSFEQGTAGWDMGDYRRVLVAESKPPLVHGDWLAYCGGPVYYQSWPTPLPGEPYWGVLASQETFGVGAYRLSFVAAAYGTVPVPVWLSLGSYSYLTNIDPAWTRYEMEMTPRSAGGPLTFAAALDPGQAVFVDNFVIQLVPEMASVYVVMAGLVVLFGLKVRHKA